MICAEPTLRFAIHHFKSDVSLACERPELFSHLKFKEIFDFKNDFLITGRHFNLNCYPKNAELLNQFINPNLVHCVDWPSLATLRMQLPIKYRRVQLHPKAFPEPPKKAIGSNRVLLHVGKGWPSKTFPQEWWIAAMKDCLERGFVPVLIGQNCIEFSGLDDGVVDLRDKLSFNQFLWLCKNSHRMITNDSAPLHIAAAGDGKIAFVSTAKRGDLITHYREGGYGWRMKDFGNRLWDEFPLSPSHGEPIFINEIPNNRRLSLPDPMDLVEWLWENE